MYQGEVRNLAFTAIIDAKINYHRMRKDRQSDDPELLAELWQDWANRRSVDSRNCCYLQAYNNEADDLVMKTTGEALGLLG